MHIPDGILPGVVVAGGYAVTGIITWHSLRKINNMDEPKKLIPKASLGTASFLVASWIHIPIPPTSVHLLLLGLLGALLGHYAFPAILIALFFQAVMFGHGGLTTLGVNAVIMGIPTIVCHFIFQNTQMLRKNNRIINGIVGFTIGAIGVAFSVGLFYIISINFIPAYLDAQVEKAALYTLAIAHIPLMIIEGIFTAFIIIYLNKVKPEMLESQ